jgi:hypothetical protein
MPGILLEGLQDRIFSTHGGLGARPHDLLIPIYSWLFWYFALLTLFRLLQRRSAERD